VIDTSKTQDEEVGDGTTSVAVLAGELLREAEKLLALKIHPQAVIRGWRMALAAAKAALIASALDHSKDEGTVVLFNHSFIFIIVHERWWLMNCGC
jgi:T-complex protein 1 subunit beta